MKNRKLNEDLKQKYNDYDNNIQDMIKEKYEIHLNMLNEVLNFTKFE